MSTKPKLVILARIGRPHGVRGALHIDQAGAHLGDFVGRRVLVGSEEYAKEIILLRAENTTVQFDGITDRDVAAGLTNNFIFVPMAELKEMVQRGRKAGQVTITDLWYFELVGMQVVDAESKKTLGRISQVEDAGMNTIVSIEPGSGSELTGTLEIPLDYPHWRAPDLTANQIGLSEWRIFLE